MWEEKLNFIKFRLSKVSIIRVLTSVSSFACRTERSRHSLKWVSTQHKVKDVCQVFRLAAGEKKVAPKKKKRKRGGGGGEEEEKKEEKEGVGGGGER